MSEQVGGDEVQQSLAVLGLTEEKAQQWLGLVNKDIRARRGRDGPRQAAPQQGWQAARPMQGPQPIVPQPIVQQPVQQGWQAVRPTQGHAQGQGQMAQRRAHGPVNQEQPPVAAEPTKPKAAYEARRAKLAAAEATLRQIGTPSRALRPLLLDYYSAGTELDDMAADGDFDGALGAMQAFEDAVKAALDQHGAEMTERADAEQEALTQTQAVKAKLTADSPSYKGITVWQEGKLGHVSPDDLLKAAKIDRMAELDDWNPGDLTPEWKQAINEVASIKLDKAFLDRNDRKCEQTARSLASNTVVREAHANWTAWMKDPAANRKKIEAALNEVIKVQSTAIGLRPRDPNAPPAVNLVKTDNPRECGNLDQATGIITINSGADAFGDFREVLDTLTHENTHALQKQMVEDLKSGALQPGDEDYAAAVTLSMNMEFYISPDASAQLDPAEADRTYKAQCTEAHAFRSGEKSGRGAYQLLMDRMPPEERAQHEQAAKAEQFAKLKERFALMQQAQAKLSEALLLGLEGEAVDALKKSIEAQQAALNEDLAKLSS